MCKSICYAVTILELTSSRILSLLSLNSYTSITGAVTLRMLSKQKNSTHDSRKLLKSRTRTGQNSVYGVLKVYRNVNHTAGRGISFQVFRSPFYLESWPFQVKEFLQSQFQHSITRTRHLFFPPLGFLFQVRNHC